MEKKDQRFWVTAVCCGVAFALLLAAQAIAGLYSDDFYYATFWREGPARFLALAVDHYRTFNGRVLVHLIAQTVLAFPQWVWALLTTALLFFTGAAAMDWQSGGAGWRKKSFAAAVFGAELLLVGLKVQRESLLWVSGSYNYIFPAALTLLACMLWSRWLAAGPGRKSALVWLLAVQVLCGATTEQCGIMTAAGTFCVGVHWLWRRHSGKKFAWALLAPMANLVGYLTIFLSPATRTRAARRGAFTLAQLLRGVPAWSRNLMAEDGIVPVALLFCLASAAFGFLHRKKLWPLLLGLPMGAALGVYLALGAPERAAAGLFLALLFYVLLTAAVLLLRSEWGAAGALLTAGAAGAVIMLPTNTFVPRSAMPFALMLMLPCAWMLTECAWACKERRGALRLAPAVGLCALTVLAAVSFAPTLAGYWANHALDVENARRVAEARKSGTLYYCIDYDERYGNPWTRMYHDGTFYRNYLDMVGLTGSRVYLTSQVRPAVRAGGERVEAVTWSDGTRDYFPAAAILRALGGSAEWNDGVTEYRLGESAARLENNVLTYSRPGREGSIPVAGEQSQHYCTQCFSAAVMEEAFGLTFVLDEGENIYDVRLP